MAGQSRVLGVGVGGAVGCEVWGVGRGEWGVGWGWGVCGLLGWGVWGGCGVEGGEWRLS